MSNDESMTHGSEKANNTQSAEKDVKAARLAVLPTGESVITPPAQFRMLLISLLAAAIGLTAGVVAFVLYNLIGLFTNIFFFHHFSTAFSSARLNHLGLWVIVTPVIGGIIVGFMAKYGSPKIKGHGIPEAMEAVLANRSRIEPRVAILKPISAAIAIGTGGPFGAEGPIIQTGGAIGSLVGQVLHTTASERKVLLACGAAAGMSATFNTPIAGVILAIELLLFEFKSRSFIPLVVASTLATAVHVRLMGGGPMFAVTPVDFGIPRALPFYLLIGALGLGIIGYFVPRVLGVGYDTIGDILNANLALKLLLIVMVAKAAALVVSLGSGTSGGLLAPMFMSSAAMGGAYAMAINRIYPSAQLAAGAFALVAMGAVFGAASRATFTFIIFAFEITRDYNSVLPLMLVSVIADGTAMVLMPKSSIMTEKLARRGMRIHTEYETDVLQQVSVGEMMDREVPTISDQMSVAELAERIAGRDPQVSKHDGLVIVDAAGNLQGIITRSDLLKGFEQDSAGKMSVLEAGTRNVLVAYPDELLHDAATKMLRRNIGRLPVVDRKEPTRVVGYLGRHGIMSARLRRLDEEHIRETGWAQRFYRR